MNKRENLIEVLETIPHPQRLYPDLYVDHLIANGVTIQKWIPVTERLPEDDSDVLAYLRIGEEGRIYPANYAKGMWFDCIFNAPATDTTTHWMPLPEPPKGE